MRVWGSIWWAFDLKNSTKSSMNCVRFNFSKISWTSASRFSTSLLNAFWMSNSVFFEENDDVFV